MRRSSCKAKRSVLECGLKRVCPFLHLPINFSFTFRCYETSRRPTAVRFTATADGHFVSGIHSPRTSLLFVVHLLLSLGSATITILILLLALCIIYVFPCNQLSGLLLSKDGHGMCIMCAKSLVSAVHNESETCRH